MSNPVEELAKKHTASKVAEKLGYSYTYVYEMAKGIKPVTKTARRRIDRAYNHRDYPATVTIRYAPEEEAMRQRHLKLSMDDRKAALEAVCVRLDSQNGRSRDADGVGDR